jgi:acetyl esterase
MTTLLSPLLDPEARHVLDLDRQAAAPPFEAGTPEEARRAYEEGVPALQGEREPVGSLTERTITGPGGPLTLRIIADRARSEPLPRRCSICMAAAG